MLAVGSIGGLYFPITAWLFIITFVFIALAFVVPYLAREKEEST